MRISDWSSDVCSSDLNTPAGIVKFDTVKPGKTGGHARVSYGRYGTSQVEVAAGAADDSGFSVRLSGLYQHRAERKSVVSGQSVSVRVDLGGRRIINKKTNKHISTQ